MPRQNGRHFADVVLNSIFFDDDVLFLNKMLLKYVSYGLIDKMAVLV